MASDGFIREVDEELQRDRMASLWKRFGPLIIGLVSLAVLATAGKVAWDAWQVRQLERQGTAFAEAEAALERDDPSAAAAAFDSLAIAQNGDSSAIARLREVEARLAAGESDAALALLTEVAGDPAIDPILRNFAAIAAAQRTIGSEQPERVRELVLSQPGSDWTFNHSARELTALAALQAGNKSEATELLRALQADTLTPVDLRRRVDEVLISIGVNVERQQPDAGAAEDPS